MDSAPVVKSPTPAVAASSQVEAAPPHVETDAEKKFLLE